MNDKKPLPYYIKTIIFLFLCIVVNVVGRTLASEHSLPGWFDSYGTFFAAYVAGPIPAAIIGAASNAVFAIKEPGVFPYFIISIFIGIGVGYFTKKGYFNTLFNTMTVAGTMTIGSVIIASVLNILLKNGDIGNAWGNGVKDYLIENRFPKTAAILIGEFYLEFPDKLLTVLALFICIKLGKMIKNKKELAKKAASASAAVLILGCFIVPSVPNKAEAITMPDQTSYVQTIYNGSNGLLCGHANAMTQTSDGILWIGTYAGLYRYNGSEFHHMSELEEIRNVNCLYVDEEGRLWVGTNDNGVAIIINNKVTNVINSADGIPSDTIRSICQSSTGEYYIGTSDGIVTLELKIGISKTSDIPEIGYVVKLAADKLGHTAAVNSEGKLFILKNGKIVSSLDASKQGRKFSCCNFTEDNTLYVGSDDGYVIEYKLDGDQPVNKRNTKCDNITKINNIYREEDQMWVCADNGIGFLNARREFTLQESGDFNHSIENMIIDYQGNLWFTSSRLGLLRLSRSSVTDIYTDTGIKPNVVNTTAVFDGLLYVGTDDGLTIIDVIRRKTIENELTEMLNGSRIRCLTNDSFSRLWICSYGNGLLSVDRSGNIRSYSNDESPIGNRVRTCCELTDGSIAATSSNGIFFIKNGTISGHIPYSDSFGYAQVLCLMQTADGTLYAGTDGNGIAVIKNGALDSFITTDDGLTSGVVLRMVCDPDDGSIYIVTSNSLCRTFKGVTETLSAFPYSNNYDVILDDDGEIFVPGSSGIYILNKRALLKGDSSNSVLINSKMGLIGSLTANSFSAKDNNKNVFLAADRGVYAMNLDSYKLKQRAFRLKVSEIRIDDESFYADRGTELKISRDTAKIEFIPEIINYSLDDPTVSYYLEGFDHDWTDVKQSELLSVAYTNLQPGDYNFHIAIRDANGNIIEESSYLISKEKVMYDNPWFKYYLLSIALIFIGWLTWFITRTQLQHTIKLKETELAMALQQVQMGNETILAIAKTVDAKDERTSKHSQRVSDYSALIAREYGFTKEEQENLRNAALLHDIGKIGIPDSVLNKPGRLTDPEYAVMKTHVTRGAEILKDFTLIEHVVEGARYHHERYDGKGYPDGLKGEQIPLYGRIISIADAFDAMTANRVYRKRQDFDYVMGELHKGRGTQFDPDLLDIFLKLIDDKVIDIDAIYANAPAAPEEEKKEEVNKEKKEEDKA